MPADTPMMRQYNAIKQQHEDCLLFFRLGDFYEMFDADARVASKELNLVLTTRDRNTPPEQQVPMCGVPAHSVESYVARLLAKGYKIAICEQTEDPKNAKGLVDREVLKIITPGTATMESALEHTENNFLGAVCTSGKTAGVAFCDFSTGECYATTVSAKSAAALAGEIRNEIGRYSPRELLLRRGESFTLDGQYGVRADTLVSYTDIDVFDSLRLCREKFGSEELPEAAADAVGMLVEYLKHTQKSSLDHMRHIEFYESRSFMELDLAAQRNLELVSSMRGDKRGSLLWTLDRTKTSMGARLMRIWLERPLIDAARITRRHEAVGEFVENRALRDELADELRGICDLERVMTRISSESANARDLSTLAATAKRMAPIKSLLANASSALLRELAGEIDTLDDIISAVDATIVEENIPTTIKDGGIIRDEFSEEVARLRAIGKGGKEILAGIEARERERSGIKTLKIGYNRVFGYYLEVRRSAGEDVPPDYIRKQTLVDRERYITEELKNFESEILTASERLCALEYEIFCDLRATVALAAGRVQQTAHAIASADILASFGEVAATEGYCRPTVDESLRLSIRDGRHPVVEKTLGGGLFVPNDLTLDCGENTVAIITGPNMAGKSTYMRQAALIVIMAQAGSFVPAREAQIGIVDRVFTRIGASDDLASGRSTFMVEMSEVADILRNATKRSLLVLDEIGRGTSTFDGMAIARAVIEWAADSKKLGAKTLFATHYHELTVLEDETPGVKNYNIAVKKRGEDIVFLRKIVRGGTDKSYGVEVAKLAGLPAELVARSHEILDELERDGAVTGVAPRISDDEQLGFAGLASQDITRELARIDVNALSPYEAWQQLAAFIARSKEIE